MSENRSSHADNEHDSNVRMPTARYVSDTPIRLVAASEAIDLRRRFEAERRAKPRFRCIECDARVHPVSNTRTETRRGGEPFFARNRSPKNGPFNAHASSCAFAFSHRVRELQKESGDGRLTRRLEAGQVVYRLSLPETFSPPDGAAGTLRILREDQEFTVEITKVLNTAIKVTLLLADLERAGATIEADFRATCNGQDVAWLDFIYTRRRLITLARRIENNGPLTHPVAAIISPSSHAVANPVWRNWSIHAGIARPDGDSGKRTAFVNAPLAEWLPGPGPRGHVAFGMWQLGEPRNGYERPLQLTLPDRDCIAPLPPGITERMLDAWLSGGVLRSATRTPDADLEEGP